jgi:hypothetical protein
MMGYGGHLTDAADNPVTGVLDVTIAFYDLSTGGNQLFEENFVNLPVEAGDLYLLLSNNEIPGGDDLDVLFTSHDNVFIELIIGTESLTPRQRLVSVPWVLSAAGGGGGSVNWGSITGIPGPIAEIANLSAGAGQCTDGRVLKVSGSSWVCADDATGGGGGGGVTSVSAGTGMSFTSITSTGSVALDTAGISSCNNSTSSKIIWNGTRLTCATDQTGGGGGALDCTVVASGLSSSPQASCPGGYSLTGGGGWCASASNHMSANQPWNGVWQVNCRDAASPATLQNGEAYAVCCRIN